MNQHQITWKDNGNHARSDAICLIAEARFDALDDGRDTEGPEWAHGMAVIMESEEWREEERPPTTCHNCGKSLKTAQARHYVAGMAVCCPDCICTGSCACPA